MDKRNILRLNVIIATIILVVMAVFGLETSFYLFPIFAISIVIFVTKFAKQNRWLFLTFIALETIAEILFLIDAEKYVSLSFGIFTIACFLLILLLVPILKGKQLKLSKAFLTELIFGFVCIGSLLFYIVYMIIDFVPDILPFIIAFSTYIISVVLCLIIPNINKSSNDVLLYGVGGSFLAQMTFAVIYQYIEINLTFIVIGFFMGYFMKIVLSVYLTKIYGFSKSGI